MTGNKILKNKIFISCLVILTVTAHHFLKYFFAYIVFGIDNYRALEGWEQTMYVQGSGLLLCFLVVGILCSFSIKQMTEMLGLDKSFLKPFLFAAVAALPMFIGNAYLNGYQEGATWGRIAWYSLWPGFNEELVFRAFIVGILVRYANWNFILAALVSGFLFASGHLYQAENFYDAVQIFLFTSGVGIGFAVFYKFWSWNIWFGIFLHTLMNLSWVLFVWEGSALMNGKENIFRFTTIAIAIAFTIYESRKIKFRK